MSRFWDFVGGTLDCRLDTPAPERFMNLCHSRKIYLADISSSGKETRFRIGLKDYRKIRPVARKCHVVPKIIRRRGLPFILYKNRRHKAFFAGIIIALALLWLLSGYVWDIEIEGNTLHTDESLAQFLKEIDVHTGQRKASVDTSWLEEELRLKYEDISWVSARIEGTVLKIELKEANVLTPEDESSQTGNIVSWQDGLIESIVTRNGTARVSAGDTVKAGDLLIEGRVDIYGDDEAVKNTHYIRADGDVYARVTYHCDDYYPAYYIEKNFTKSKKYQVNFEVFGNMFTVGKATLPETDAGDKYSYDEVSQVTKYRLTKNFYLPLAIQIKTVRQFTPQTVYYTDEELDVLGQEAIAKKLETLEKDGAKIISQNLLTVKEKEYYAIRGDIEMVIPIGKFEAADTALSPESPETVESGNEEGN